MFLRYLQNPSCTKHSLRGISAMNPYGKPIDLCNLLINTKQLTCKTSRTVKSFKLRYIKFEIKNLPFLPWHDRPKVFEL